MNSSQPLKQSSWLSFKSNSGSRLPFPSSGSSPPADFSSGPDIPHTVPSSSTSTHMGHSGPLTFSGISIDSPVTQVEGESFLEPVTRFLNVKLERIVARLSPESARHVLQSLWNQVLRIIEDLLLPSLYGSMELDRKLWNRRQVSLIQISLEVSWRSFFVGNPSSYLSICSGQTR